MEDTLWSEIMESPGEIFDLDIPEDFDRSRFFDLDEQLEQTFESKLNSNFDF